jgi:polyhydroxyalkanoate synthesis repressor PhaR
MSQTGPADTAPQQGEAPPVVVKKYANRRLYNTESSSYITLDTLAEMVRGGRDFVVYDAKTAEDITRSVLTQIIVEEESKGRAMLPTGFLRQLIGFYGDSMQAAVPKYLEQAMGAFAAQQAQMSKAVQTSMGQFFPPGLEEVGRQNRAMVERAMSLFTPFLPQEPKSEPKPEARPASQSEIDALRAEVESLRRQLAASRAKSDS